MARIDVSGTVYWDSGLPPEKSGRAPGTIVKYRAGSVNGSVITDDDGDFDFSGIDESDNLALILLHEGALPTAINKKSGEFGAALELRLHPSEGKRAVWFGAALLFVFAIGLIALTSRYLASHDESASIAATEYSGLIVALTALAESDQTTTADSLRDMLAAVKTARLKVNSTRIPLSDDVSSRIDRLLAHDIKSDTASLDELASSSEAAADLLRSDDQRYFWTGWPWLMVEVWCWGLFGVLLTKIVRIGWYLRTSSYHANGTWMHVAHVVATPFLALVAVLALSFIKLENESQTVVNLSNPLFMVLTACLLSTNPWGLWDFVLGRGDALRKKVDTIS